MLIQNATQTGQNFLSKTALQVSALPQEEMTRVERDNQERIANKLELAGNTPAAVFVRSQLEKKESKNDSPRQKEIGKLQERITQIQEKMTEIKNDKTLQPDEMKEKLKKLDEQMAALQEKMQKLQEEELEKFKAQKEEKKAAEKKVEERKQPSGSTKQKSGEADESDAANEAPRINAGTLAITGLSLERAQSVLSLSEHLQAKATFWQHALDDFIRHQMRPIDNPPPDPVILATRRDVIFETKRAAGRLEDAAVDAVKEAENAVKAADKPNDGLPQPNDISDEEALKQRGPYNAIGSAPAPKAAKDAAQGE